jgi:hypothetical protein
LYRSTLKERGLSSLDEKVARYHPAGRDRFHRFETDLHLIPMLCARRSIESLDDRRFVGCDHEKIEDPANDRASSGEREGDPAVNLSRPEELGGNRDVFARRRVFPAYVLDEHSGFVGIG